MPARASNHNCAQPADLRVIKCRGRPRPAGAQARAGVGLHGAGVELDGVHQRHGMAAATAVKRQAVRGRSATRHRSRRRPHRAAPEIVEPDRRVGPGQSRRRCSGSAADRRSAPSGRARSCSLASLITAPSAAPPADHLRPAQPTHGPPTCKATGYLVVNQPTVRDRSTCSSRRPVPRGARGPPHRSRSARPPVPKNSATPRRKPINRISCIPA